MDPEWSIQLDYDRSVMDIHIKQLTMWRPHHAAANRSGGAGRSTIQLFNNAMSRYYLHHRSCHTSAVLPFQSIQTSVSCISNLKPPQLALVQSGEHQACLYTPIHLTSWGRTTALYALCGTDTVGLQNIL